MALETRRRNPDVYGKRPKRNQVVKKDMKRKYLNQLIVLTKLKYIRLINAKIRKIVGVAVGPGL